MGLIWLIGIIFWAAGEASFFFIVPDVLLTLAALRFGFRTGAKLAVLAAIVASFTGGVLWFWGAHDIASAEAAMLRVPAIGPDLLERARNELQSGFWQWHMVIGAMTGVPYKVYAVEAGTAQIALPLFLIASFFARFLRFAGTILLAKLGQAVAMRAGLAKIIYPGWIVVWLIVYAIYFSVRGLL